MDDDLNADLFQVRQEFGPFRPASAEHVKLLLNKLDKRFA
jgi:hypothetical protein